LRFFSLETLSFLAPDGITNFVISVVSPQRQNMPNCVSENAKQDKIFLKINLTKSKDIPLKRI